jgi:hypothetical protein
MSQIRSTGVHHLEEELPPMQATNNVTDMFVQDVYTAKIGNAVWG